MNRSAKKKQRYEDGMKRARKWGEFMQSSNARDVYRVHSDKLREAYNKWCLAAYPEDAQEETAARAKIIEKIVDGLRPQVRR
jgi:formiminotetrahydrofolate cyclodeaminase